MSFLRSTRLKGNLSWIATSLRARSGIGNAVNITRGKGVAGLFVYLLILIHLVLKGYKSGKEDKVDEGMLLGDYPTTLPWKSAQELPATGWWDDQDRRNKEDPVISGYPLS